MRSWHLPNCWTQFPNLIALRFSTVFTKLIRWTYSGHLNPVSELNYTLRIYSLLQHILSGPLLSVFRLKCCANVRSQLAKLGKMWSTDCDEHTRCTDVYSVPYSLLHSASEEAYRMSNAIRNAWKQPSLYRPGQTLRDPRISTQLTHEGGKPCAITFGKMANITQILITLILLVSILPLLHVSLFKCYFPHSFHTSDLFQKWNMWYAHTAAE